MNCAAWAWMAATTCGWQWPVLVTAMPLEKSRYSTPSVVVTTQPEPGGHLEVGDPEPHVRHAVSHRPTSSAALPLPT